MDISRQTQAILLLTTHFIKAHTSDVKPLSVKEWGRFAKWLQTHSLTPDMLLDNPDAILKDWDDAVVSRKRIELLMRRSMALALALERWENAGIWILSRSDKHYPKALKKYLGQDSPPIIFGVGDPDLLNSSGIAIVGSRNASEQALATTVDVAQSCVKQGISVVSGGAKGVDQAAMISALELNGSVIGVLADSLLKAATSGMYRSGLRDRRLVLLSTFNPEAHFNVGNAMQRNKYIYTLAKAAVVISVTANKGGTWAGAIEAIKNQWVPVWVNRATQTGHVALIQRGAHWLPESIDDYCCLFKYPELVHQMFFDEAMSVPSNHEQLADPKKVQSHGLKLYEVFLEHLKMLIQNDGLASDDLSQSLNLTLTQTKVWLNKAIADGYVIKLNRPVRYVWSES